MKRGSITIFLALILSLLLSLVCTSIESVRMAAARTQILNSMDIGLYSLFGQYDRILLKDYDLFFLNGSGNKGKINLSSLYDELENYMKPLLEQNSQKLAVKQGGFSGYRLATDQDGEVFFRQAVTYMKKTLGAQGIQSLINRFQEQGERVREAEETGNQAEGNQSIESYDAEMEAAAQNSEAAHQESENTSGENGGQTGEPEISDRNQPSQVVNPIPILKRIRNMSLLDLIVPAEKGISENTVEKSSLCSGRRCEKGMGMLEEVKKDDSYISQLLFQQYLENRLGSYTAPADCNLKYQKEYLLCGKNSDRENLKSTASRLLMVREGVNAAYLMTDPVKRAQVQSMALAIASAFLVPPASVIIEAALLLCWSFGESLLDLRELFHGGKVPFVKHAGNWQLALENLADLMENLDSGRRNDESGLSYEEYLQLMIVSESKKNKVSRGMDMIEMCIRSSTGQKGFRLDHCIEAIEASVDVKANRKKIFTVKKQYSYL